MQIVVSSVGDGLDAQVSPIFGRCAYFVFVDSETLEARSVLNSAVSASGGAGVQSAQLVVAEGAQAVLTGNVGPNAMGVLQAAGVPVYPVSGGTVREAVESFKLQGLSTTADATAPRDTGKTGMMGGGQGGGMGRGMGGGGGRGQGGGGGRGAGGGGRQV